MQWEYEYVRCGLKQQQTPSRSTVVALMETMSPQQGTFGQNRSGSLTGDSKLCALPDSKKKMKTLAHRRQSAPSLVISKALTKSRSMSRENCLSPVSPETCPLVQAFLSPGRVFLAHAHTQLKTGLQTQERHLFLFTDTLLIAKAKSSTHFKLKAQVRLCEMWTAGCMEEVCEGSTSLDRSFVMGWPTFNCVATFSSVEHKEKWLFLIKSRINEEKEKDDPKTIPLKIFAKDIGNCAYAKTLAVSNSDSTTDVIQMALQQFGISGCVKDHQLWVSSIKDDSPYPLIGHEFPFSIKMSHIRDGGGGGGKDAVPSPEGQGAMLLDQCLPPDTQCQFILKSSRVGPKQALLLEPGQKSFKRKRPLINWAFWRGSSSQLDSVPLSPTSLSPTLGCLFGRSLSSICPPDHTLPKPVMDMLVFLYQEGPYTRGIFRRSAGAKACRELRDRLDNGTEDTHTLTHESVFVTAAVFKDFLRNIPGSLLCVNLYEQWVAVMAQEEEEQRMQAIHRLVHLLPSDNLLLLRHVVAVLHCIQDNAGDNQMNAFNLSVCIAPSMLWTLSPCSPEGEATKKVCELVRFLIENCRKVLGDDVPSLFSGFPQKSNSSDHGSDVSSFQMNDSSYDSLENELNEDPESPFQESHPLRDKAKPDSCSRDSVITLSDCDPDPDPEAEADLLHIPPLARPRKFTPALRQPRPRQCYVQSQGPRRLRRSSEPAIGHTPGALIIQSDKHHLASRKASYDAAMEGEEEEEEDEVFQGLRALQLKDKVITGGERGGVGTLGQRKLKHTPPSPLRLDASCSSLSSPATSPTGSSLSSLDSAFSQYSTDYVTSAGFLLAESSPRSPLSPRSPKCSPPKRDTVDWSESQPPHSSRTPSTHHGLHPNTWLKRNLRLSLRQPDNGHLEEEVGKGKGVSLPKASECKGVEVTTKRRSSSPPSYQQAILQLQKSRSPFYRGTEKPLTVRELQLLHDQACNATHRPPTGRDVTQRPTGTGSEVIQPPQDVFYGQSGSTLTLQRQKSHSLTLAMEAGRKVLTLPRRASEPSMVTDAASILTLERPLVKSLTHGVKGQQLPESGLRVSDIEPQRNGAGPNSEPRFCLSPSATRAVRDYFSSQEGADSGACLQRSQEVALALVQGKREWQSRKCSDPCVDDFDQMFFAEESYV
ncbi:rho GTPase-activating protein 20-like [Oncorhynchus tshawytscha]|uniref:Rho GTPase-activating protein 20 n=1 Tax=Oncorhynchus tshawytscha TaxID=74940 RepID=A0AAZ3P1B5_ONCTS|nr:rho GTPase-activating protein 20-like [Oncorhynchus tshawytscha]